VSNADLGRTFFQILGVKAPAGGALVGRVIAEALSGGEAPRATSKILRAPSGIGGVQTVLMYQVVGETKYFDLAGSKGRTLGLEKQ
jgi:hypothetical protein